MNFLAHLYLADDDPESRIGNLLPDLCRRRVLADLDPAVRAGVARHRLVDRLTDRHPRFRAGRQRLSPRHGLFAGILVDVWYDHVLAAGWRRYHPTPLPAFAAHVYAQMLSRADLMPPPMRAAVERMARQDWLSCYATVDGLADVLERLARRFARDYRRSFDARRALDDLEAGRFAYAGEFDAVMGDVAAAVQESSLYEPPGGR